MQCCVIVPTYNRAPVIGQTLDSLLGQTVPPAQLIVVDDGSTDGTGAAVRPYGDRILYLAKENGGKSSALNLALSKLRPEIDLVWVFDDDDVALPDALERHIAALRATGAGFSYSSYIAAREAPDGSFQPMHDVRTPRIEADRFLSELLLGSFIPHPAFLVRRSVQERVGPYDETLVRSQDYDMILRVARAADPAWVDGPTYFRRYSDAPRGAAHDRFAAALYEQKAHDYEARLFRKVHASLELREYLPRTAPYREADARIARLSVMAIRGLWDLCAEDAERLTETDLPLSPESILRLWRVGSRPAAVLNATLVATRRIPRPLRTIMGKSFVMSAMRIAMPPPARLHVAWKATQFFA